MCSGFSWSSRPQDPASRSQSPLSQDSRAPHAPPRVLDDPRSRRPSVKVARGWPHSRVVLGGSTRRPEGRWAPRLCRSTSCRGGLRRLSTQTGNTPKETTPPQTDQGKPPGLRRQLFVLSLSSAERSTRPTSGFICEERAWRGAGGGGKPPPPIPGVPGRCTGQTTAGRDAATQPSGRGKPGAAQGRRSARGPRPAAPGPPTVGPHRGTCPGFEVESDFSCVRNKRPEMQTCPARLAERSSIRPPAPPLLVHQPADPDEAEGAGGLETGRRGHRTGPAPVSRGRGHRDLLLRLRTSASWLS